LFKKHLAGLSLPILVAAYPILFLYGHNAQVLDLESLKIPLVYSVLIAVGAYFLIWLFLRKPVHASLAAFVAMLFYYAYGTVYRLLLAPDRFQIEHFLLIPLLVVVVGYIAYFLSRLKPSLAMILQKVLLVISSGLVVVNLAITVPVEVEKAAPKPTPIPTASHIPNTGKRYPDIYFIILDEYLRFDDVRAYFDDHQVDQFEDFLKVNHFFIASKSRVPTINTRTEITSRLNLHQYTLDDDVPTTFKALYDNKVMQILKSYGYTTAVLEMAFKGFNADYSLQYEADEISGMASDEFYQTFMDNTMFDAFSDTLQASNPVETRQRDIILYTLNMTTEIPESESPRFIYTHVLLPHQPFIFDEDGNLLPPQDMDDWHYYIGQLNYTSKLAEDLIARLLANADPNNPPVIILQSDHGARNLIRTSKDNIILNGHLENFPLEYAHDTLNAMYLPGYDTSTLPDDLEPIRTFEIVLNHYLDAGVSVDRTSTKH
jgi:hypothetical protein